MKTTFLLCNLFLISILSFSQSDSNRIAQPNEERPFTIVEQMPSFPGGEEKMMTFVRKNLNTPESAMKDNVHGRVYVSFVVNKTGDVENVKVIKGIRSDVNNAAIDVVTKMPKWKAGQQNGRPVNVVFNLPIDF